MSDIKRQIRVAITYETPWIRRREILVCALTGSLGIFLLDAMIFHFGVHYYSDDDMVLHSVAAHDIMATFRITSFFRPIEYLILLAANRVYLPLWLGASLLCVVGATILSALACELLFERRIPKAGWWVLGVANPLLFYLVSTAGTVSQTLCNLLFAGAMLAFISELHRLQDRPLSGWCSDRTAAFLNLMAALLFFTKETAVAAAVVLPATTALMRLKTRRLSTLFLCSLLLPIGAASIWTLIKLQFPLYTFGVGRYNLKLDPITWSKNAISTLAFPITPLPSSFIAFAVLRPLWVGVALGAVFLFLGMLLREVLHQPRVIISLLVVSASCAPMILIHSSELYSSMIAPFAVSIILLVGTSTKRWPSLAYGLALYAASLGNCIVFCMGADFTPLNLKHLQYSIYGKEHQQAPTCPIGTTAHVAWGGTAITCIP